jgi:RNase H-fold protein (predicted Holliday junction resolvase)
MDITRDRIGLCLSYHPSAGEEPIQLDDIPLELETRNGKRVVADNIISHLQDLVQQNKVCGVVVAWPLQKDGRMGAPCGKVLHALDSLVANSKFLTPNRPFCLWDGSHVEEERCDSWGRCSAYGKEYSLNQEVHIASQEHYVPATNLVACDIWNDFMRTHWPELYFQQQERRDVHDNFDLLVEDYELEDDRLVASLVQ